MLTSVHPPFDTRIFHRIGKTLAGEGYEVVLIAPHPRDETTDGIKIRAVPQLPGRLNRMTRTVGKVCRMALKEQARIYHLHDPELIPAGIWLKLCGKKVVYDVHEDLPRQILDKGWLHPAIRRVIAALAGCVEKLGTTFFDGFVAATPTIARRFPGRKSITVFNFPPATGLTGCIPYRLRESGVVYAGVIAGSRGARQMVEAINLLPEGCGVRLAMAGKFSPPGLEQLLTVMPGWDRVDFKGWLSRDKVDRLMSGARAGLVVLHPTPGYLESYPVKMFEYMAAGTPVIASDFPLWRRIITEAGCGLLVDPLEPASIAGAIQWILEHPLEAAQMGERGREAVLDRYRWETEAGKLLQFYRKNLAGQENLFYSGF